MHGLDQRTGRLYQRVVGMKGMNTASPARSLPDGESPNLSGALLSTGNIVPGKVKGAAAFTSPGQARRPKDPISKYRSRRMRAAGKKKPPRRAASNSRDSSVWIRRK